MKVLVAAFACAPVGSSEEFLGWQAIRAVSRRHHVWVITTPRYRQEIERAQSERAVPDHVHFNYLGGDKSPVENATLSRLKDWWDYVDWSRTILPLARDLHASIGFQLVHHVTYSAWRVPSSLWRLRIPFVWGPIGGGGDTPLRFLTSMSFAGAAFESLRKVAQLAAYLPGPRRCAREASWILASNSETAQLLLRMRRSAQGVSVMWPTYFSDAQIARFTSTTAWPKPPGALRIFAGGTALGSKGLAIALRGLRKAADAGVEFIYTIASDGPERAHLECLTRDLGLETRVRFVQQYSGDAYISELRGSHCYLLPSFRENLGLTMIEAMMSGVVPIVANISAPGEVVTSRCGFTIAVTSCAQMIRAIAEAVEWLALNPEEIRRLGTNAVARAREVVNASCYADQIEATYAVAINREQPFASVQRRAQTARGESSFCNVREGSLCPHSDFPWMAIHVRGRRVLWRARVEKSQSRRT